VPHRLLAAASALAIGDYLVWNWSLAGNHGTLALVSGLTLPLLAIVLIRLLVWNLVRLIGRTARSRRLRADGREARSSTDHNDLPVEPLPVSSSSPSSGKLAA
jgi:hypothetical protein